MSQYDIRRRCGCVETLNITGTNVRGQRDDRARYLAQFDCADCRRKVAQQQSEHLAARALEISGLGTWPALTGSPGQLAWAAEERAAMLAALVETLGGAPALPLYVNAALRQTTARWWLDRRGLAQPMRRLSDLLNAPGIDRAHHGSLTDAVEAVMTDAERHQLTEGDYQPPSHPATQLMQQLTEGLPGR